MRLLLSILLPLLLFMSRATAAEVPYFANKTKINVCTSEYTPMVFCSGLKPEEYSGYEIELFRNVSALLGWQPSMLKWSCMDWDEMIDHLKAADGVCDIAVAGIEVTAKELDDGVVFTWPTYRNGLGILAKKETAPRYGQWSFFDAFEWEVWVVAIATMITVPFIVWGIDWIAYWGKYPEGVSESDYSLNTYFWAAITRPMWMRGQKAVSWAGNIVVTAFAFLIMVLIALYVGYATSNLTTSLLDSQITGVESLPGKAIGTWTGFEEKLQRYGVAPATFPWDNAEDEEAMMRRLHRGTVKALVLDASFVSWVAESSCDFTVVGSTFSNYEQATAFPRNFNNSELLQAYNTALAKLSQALTTEAIAADTLTPADAPDCPSTEASSAITFYQVAGLWILLAGAVGVGLILVLLHILHVRFTRPVIQKSAVIISAGSSAKKLARRLSSGKSGGNIVVA